jgi:hypothetical protein
MGRRPQRLPRHGAGLGGVRINPPFAVTVLLMSALCGLVIDQRQREFELTKEGIEIRKMQCDVALTFLKSLDKFDGKPWLIIHEPEVVISMEEIQSFLRTHPNLKTDPQMQIAIKKVRNAKLSPVVLCKSIRLWVKENGIRSASEPAQDAKSVTPDWLIPNRKDQYDWHIVKISMPVISDDRKRAYMDSSEYFGPLGGGGEALTFEKKAGRSWSIIERHGNYIS